MSLASMMLATSCGSLSRDVGGVVRDSASQPATSSCVKCRSMASCAGASIGRFHRALKVDKLSGWHVYLPA